MSEHSGYSNKVKAYLNKVNKVKAYLDSKKRNKNPQTYIDSNIELMRSLVKKAEEMFGPVEPLNSHEHTPNVDFRSKEEIDKVLKMSPEVMIRRKTEKIEREAEKAQTPKEAEKTQTPKDDSIDNCCKYRIRKERPGYYNDGDGSVSIECLEDCSKNLKIVQQNCVINNQQIVNIYDYVQQNPGITSPRVTKSSSKEYEGEDNEFSVHFFGKDGKKITINLADLPKAKNVELMKSLTAVSFNNLSRGRSR